MVGYPSDSLGSCLYNSYLDIEIILLSCSRTDDALSFHLLLYFQQNFLLYHSLCGRFVKTWKCCRIVSSCDEVTKGAFHQRRSSLNQVQI